ncbi:MAG: hypothetical protein O7J95_13370 [Planctomycetota bacterium]|nr:hypothetical protein [Planctomycetota bacterium]
MKFRSAANRKATRLGCLALSLCLAGGCGKPREVPPSRILKVSGDNQADLPLEALKLPLTVRVMGSRSRDILGRKGSRYPASGVAVTFEVEDLEEILGAEGEVTTDGDEERDAASPPSGAGALTRYPVLLAARGGEPGNEPGRLEVETDASGVARVFVVLGTENGDWRVEARLRDPGTGRKINEFFRVICGVRKIDEIREANVGDDVPLKLELHEWVGRKGGDGSLRPLRKRVVFFRVVGQPYGTEESAKIRNRRDETDKNGVRDDTEVTLGDRAGTYYVLAEVEPYVEVEPGGGPSGPEAAGRTSRSGASSFPSSRWTGSWSPSRWSPGRSSSSSGSASWRMVCC